uniref:KIB1-4 beta-propeller domain-containing protein n=2 Tax=Lactuca sativa TaxID=4236 RepID=A0A9R1UYF0_LACSA|nr:hypothetical protein LSAT_V11C700348870 [Lactuca sativa]
MIPQLGGRECLGLSCGYLILFGEKTRDFWLVNPITRHQLHFPNVPTIKIDKEITIRIRAVLVFSPSLNSWVFVMTSRATYEIWFSIAEEGEGKGGAWNCVSSSFRIIDIHAFKGKIYTLTYAGDSWLRRHVCELRLDPPVPKLTLLDTHFVGSTSCVFNFVS